MWEDQKETTKTPEQRINSPVPLDLTQKTGVELPLGHSLEMNIVEIRSRKSGGWPSPGNL